MRAQVKGGVTAEMIEAFEAKGKELFATRKALASAPPTAGLAAPADLQALALSTTQPLHSTVAGGVLSLAIAPRSAPNEPAAFVATGGADHTVQIFDLAAGRISASLPGHTKKVRFGFGSSFVGTLSHWCDVRPPALWSVRLLRALVAGHPFVRYFFLYSGTI